MFVLVLIQKGVWVGATEGKKCGYSGTCNGTGI